MNAITPKQVGTPAVTTVQRPSVITFNGVGKVYPSRKASAEVVALADINLQVPEGAILGVIGKSGAGKSTLIRMINGLDIPTRGEVLVKGINIGALDEKALRHARRSIGMIFQHFNLLSSRTAYGNIALPLEIAGYPKQDIPGIVEPLLDMVGLADKRDRYPAELSGGQKQRVGIARALATKPDVLLSDEATSALDPETTEQILALLKKINVELNLTIVFITHEMDVVRQLADRVAVIENGGIVEQGTTYEIFANPRHQTTRNFVGTVTGSIVPGELLARLHPDRNDGDAAVLRLGFVGGDAGQPVLSGIARNHDVDINLMHGQLESISGHPFGTLIVAIDAAPTKLQAIMDDLSAGSTRVEHLGYVAATA